MARFDPQTTKLKRLRTRSRQFPQARVKTVQTRPPVRQRTYTREELRIAGIDLARAERGLSGREQSVRSLREKVERREAAGEGTGSQRAQLEIQERGLIGARSGVRAMRAALGSQTGEALRFAPQDYTSGRFQGEGLTGQELKGIRSTISDSQKIAGIYQLPSGDTIVTQARTGSFRNRRGEIVSVRAGAVGTRFPQPPVTPVVEQPSRLVSPEGTTITGGMIQTLGTKDAGRLPRPPSRQSRSFVGLVEAQNLREQARAERGQRQRDIFRAVPLLGGDNLLQRTGREFLAVPSSIPIGLFTTAQTVGERARVVRESARFQPERTKEVLSSSTKEVPLALARTVDPRTPEGIVYIALIAGGGYYGVTRAPVSAGATISTSRVSSSAKGFVVVEQVELTGTMNRLFARQGTRTTRVTPTGRTSVRLQTEGGLTITDTILPSKPGVLTRTVVGRNKKPARYEFKIREGVTQEPIRLEPIDTKVLRQSFSENIRPDLLKQVSVRREQGSFALTVDDSITFGKGTVQTRTGSLAEQGATNIRTSLRFSDLKPGAKLGEAVTSESIPGLLRPGGKTSKGLTVQERTPQIADLELGLIEQTSVVGVRPAPRVTSFRDTILEFRAPPVRRKLPLGRKGEQLLDVQRTKSTFMNRFKSFFEEPTTVRRPSARAPPSGLNIPRPVGPGFRLGTAGITLSGVGVGSRASIALSDKQVLDRVSKSALDTGVGDSSRFRFDTSLRQSSAQAQQSFFGSSQVSTFSSPPPGVSSSFVPPVVPRGGVPVGGIPLLFFRGRPTQSRGKPVREGSERGFLPSRTLAEVFFGGGGSIAKVVRGGFTGLEFARSKPRKRKRKKATTKKKKTKKRSKR